MKKQFRTILKIIIAIVAIYSIGLGVIYLKFTTPSDREVWRIPDNNISDPIIVNNLLLFKGHKGKFPGSWCEYLYAVDKNTGKPVWSSENYATDKYCDHSWGPVRADIIGTPVTGNMIFISSSYWETDDELNYSLYALSSTDGKVLWEVEGYAGYPLEDFTADPNVLFVASKEGSLSAIDSRTGNQIWSQNIARADYSKEILIEYYDGTVYYSGNDALTAFHASDGRQIWSVSNPRYAEDIMFSDNILYFITSSASTSNISFMTALNVETGNQIWELAFEHISTPEIIGNEIYIWAGYYTLSNLVVVNKNTGELVWKFNGDYSHGDIRYIIENNVIYIGTKDGFLLALDRKTGQIIWQTKSSGFPYELDVEKDILVVAYAEEKYIAAFDTESGRQKWISDVGINVKYPREFMITSDKAVYIASPSNRKVYSIDIKTGRELWFWNLNYPGDKMYYLKALDDALYVDQDGRFLGKDWFFALKTKP